MTFEEYIRNPAGKGASNTPNKGMYEQYYTGELDKLLLKVNGKIDYTLSAHGEKYYILFKIPHHTYDNFFYDVVIEFSANNNAIRVNPDLKGYDVKFFSNDPSFTFTWAFAFNKSSLLIKEFKSKASPLSLKMNPTVRNPSESTGYNKYIYYAFLLTKLYGLFEKSKYTLGGKPFSVLNNMVSSANAKFEERKKKEEEYKKLPKGKKDNIEKQHVVNTVDNTDTSKLVSKTHKVQTTEKVAAVKRSNLIKNVTKVKRSKRI